MATTMTKLKDESTAPSLESAEARWAKIHAKHCKMIEARDGMQMARSLYFDRNNKRVPERLRKIAAPFMKLAVRRPQKLDEQLDDVADEIADFEPEYQAERDLWAAVLKIGEALSALSLAMEEEAEIRSELASTAPETESALLPNCIAGLVVGSLGDFNSPASDWARRMRKIGILG